MSSISEIIINSRITNTKINIPDKKKKNIHISEGYKIQNTVFEFFQKNNLNTRTPTLIYTIGAQRLSALFI